MKNSRKVSFIIPNWNHRELLYECIASIYNTGDALSHEIIVIDNASVDGSSSYIKKAFPEVICVQNDTNLGYAKAVNQGVAVARGEFLCLLNNDVKLMGNATERLLLFLTVNPKAGAVAPLLYPTVGSILLEKLHINKFGPFMKLKLTPEEHLSGGEVLQPMASVLMVRKECWEAVGPMDESFPIFFNDVDWCCRLYKNTRYKIFLCPDAKAIHHEGASVRRLGYKKNYELCKGLLKFYRKHYL
jgi:N-acetylglucosaminyl-diphospho-decaprenol L-rhamnosyltransferase